MEAGVHSHWFAAAALGEVPIGMALELVERARQGNRHALLGISNVNTCAEKEESRRPRPDMARKERLQ